MDTGGGPRAASGPLGGLRPGRLGRRGGGPHVGLGVGGVSTSTAEEEQAWRVRADRRRRRAVLVVMALTAAAFSVAPIWNCLRGVPRNKDYTLWYLVAQVVRIGGEVYPHDARPFPFMYPPSCATLLALGGLGGETAFVVGLTLLQTAAWAGAVALSVFLATGRVRGQHPLLYLAPSLCVIPLVHDMYLLGQPNLLLLTLMLGMAACLRVGRPWAAGWLVALAAGIKAFPVLALGWLVYRGHHKATAGLAVGLVALLLVLPAGLFRGVDRAVDDLVTWTRGMVLTYDQGTIAQRPERSYSFKNQSIIAVSHRLLRPVLADGEADQHWRVNVASLGFRAVNGVLAAEALLLGGFYLAVMPRRNRRTERSDAAETAMLMVLIVMFSPLSFNYAYVWLIYPLTVGLHAALLAPAGSTERRALACWLGAVVLLLAATLAGPRVVQAYGNLFGAGLVLLVGLGLHTRRWGAVATAPAV